MAISGHFLPIGPLLGSPSFLKHHRTGSSSKEYLSLFEEEVVGAWEEEGEEEEEWAACGVAITMK